MNAEEIKEDMLERLNRKNDVSFKRFYNPDNGYKMESDADTALRKERIARMFAIDILNEISCENKSPEKFLDEVELKSLKLFDYPKGGNARAELYINNYREKLAKESSTN